MTLELERLQQQTTADGKLCVVSALIKNKRGHIFVQKRTLDRQLFPGCWDVVGGHVETGETLFEALAREVKEETGWQLTRLVALLDTVAWEAHRIARREFSFLVEVEGDLEHPVLEKNKVSEHRWLSPGQLDILKENRSADDLTILRLVENALAFNRPKNDGLY